MDKELAEKIAARRAEWLAAATDIFVGAGLKEFSFKEIPNEYCGPTCCPSNIWLLVATKIGIIKIGWRKRVIAIDWSQTFVEKTGKELFRTEDVTKWETGVHAWSYEKATEYVEKLVKQIPS